MDATQSAPEHRRFLEPYAYPFRQEQWLNRMWWLPLVNYIPVINVILYRGWRLEMVRRMARGEGQPLPGVDLARFFLNGIVLWAMTGFYALVPIVLIATLGVGGFVDLLEDLRYFYDLVFSDKPVMPLDQFLKYEFVETIVAVAIDSIWIVLSLPLYRAAMIRYALTGRLRSFFNVPANAFFVVRHFMSFVHIYVFTFVSAIVTALMIVALVATGFGIFVAPLVLPVYYWTSAAEYGFVARRLASETGAIARI